MINAKIFERIEIVLYSDISYKNPFLDIETDAVFVHESGRKISVPGFWNGGNEWKVRFSPDITGKWNYETFCTDKKNTSLTEKGVINVAESVRKTDIEKHGYPKIAEGKRYFTYADGEPFFYIADTHWQMPDFERLHECNYPGCTCGNQFKHLADDRKKKGFTVYQTYFNSSETGGGGNKIIHHWWSEKYSLINPQAFNETMDVMIEYLTSLGIVTAIGFGAHTSTIMAYDCDPKPILAFARYCVARYACYPVLWFTAQEITYKSPETFAIWKQVGEYVGKIDGYHRPNGAHMCPIFASDPRVVSLDKCSWHQWWALQAGHGGYNCLKTKHFYRSYYELASKKPYIETECQYEDVYVSKFNGYEASRIGAWQAIQSGCGGFTYGVTGIWAMGWNQTSEPGWLQYSAEPWYVGMDKPGSTEISHLKKFYEYVGWHRLTPSFDHEFGAFEMRKYVAISHYEKDIVVYYLFSFEEETGVLTGLKANTKYQMRWFDPVNGRFIDLPDAYTSQAGSFIMPKRPSERDWVLLLNCIELGNDYKTEIYPVTPAPISPKLAALGEEIRVKSIKASACADGHPAENMIDGNPETYWEPFASRVSNTIVVDLGRKSEFDYIGISAVMDKCVFYAYRLYGSDDGVNFEPIAERATKDVAIGGQYPVYYDPIHADCRYVKLFIASTGEEEKFRFSEIGFFKKRIER